MTLTDWYSPLQVPARRGWYLRDHRNVSTYVDPQDRCICLDLWEPAPAGDILHPGVWYVWEPEHGLNDASQQRLPWRGLTCQVLVLA